jgi:hypothetical protein
MKTVPDTFPPKTRAGSIIYGFNFRNFLGLDTIATATWFSLPGDLTFSSEVLSSSNRVANAQISGGQSGIEYLVSCRITTATSGETFEVRAPLYILRDNE